MASSDSKTNTNPPPIPTPMVENPSTLNTQPTLVQPINPANQLAAIRLDDKNFLIWRQHALAGVRGFGLEGYIQGQHSVHRR